jgi:hypothetical protein
LLYAAIVTVAGLVVALGLALGVAGDKFTVDGKPRFLVLVSYFDALDASDAVLQEDFDNFQRHGVNGVRIFANWWDCANKDRCKQPSPRTLMDATGALRPAQLERLRHVLDLAASHKLVVDLTFTREPVDQLDPSGYERGILATARALKDQAPHVLFDVQNEIEIHGLGTGGDAEISANVARLRAAIKQIDSTRLVVASTGSLDLAKQFASRDAVDAIAFHDPRVCDWWTRTGVVVRDLKTLSGSGKPVYLQEPTAYQQAGARPGRDDTDASHFAAALRAAREAGAAAWVFHTRKGFRLDDRSFTAQQEPGEQEFLRSLRSSR